MFRSEASVPLRRLVSLSVFPLLAALAPGFLGNAARAQKLAEPVFAESVFSGFGAADSGAAWKRIAGTTINEGLADPAGGPVSALWYSPAGTRLMAQTAAGRIFET